MGQNILGSRIWIFNTRTSWKVMHTYKYFQCFFLFWRTLKGSGVFKKAENFFLAHERTFECQKTSETDNLTFYESTFVGKEKSFLCDLQCLFVILLMCRHTFTGLAPTFGPNRSKNFLLKMTFSYYYWHPQTCYFSDHNYYWNAWRIVGELI